MSITGEQMSRLSRPVRAEIERLRADLADAQQRLAAGPGDSDTFADPHSEVVRPLGRGTRIRFGGSDFQQTVDAWWENGCLIIKGNEGDYRQEMLVVPQSASTVRIGFGRLER